MTRKEQNKILDAKIESNVNQYKVDRLNAEISAFSSGDLNEYEFLKRIDLNYKPDALVKARFEFSPLGRAFNEGLDKTIPNYQEEGVIKLLKEIRDNLAGLPMLPGPPGLPSPPSSASPPSSTSLTNITTPGSSSLTNVTPLPPPDSLKKTRTIRSRSKSLQSDSQNFLDQLKIEASQRPRPKSPPVIPLMPAYKTNSDGAIKKIKEQDESSKLLKTKIKEQDESSKLLKKYYKKLIKDTILDDIIKELNEQDEKNKLLYEQRKLLIQQNEHDKILKQQNDEQKKLLEEQKKLAEEKEEENMLRDIKFKNIDPGPFVKPRKFFPRRDIKKPTLCPSKIPAPITKSCEPQGLAAGEQASIAIMEIKLGASKDIIEYLKKELNNTELLSQRYFEIKDKIIKEEYTALEIEKNIREHKEDKERRYGRKI